jgi:outer membrane lipoprotein-sorting protein
MTRWHGGVLTAATLAVLVTGCASARVGLPTGEGDAFLSYADAWADATAACRAVTSLSAELSISGRAGPERLHGRVAAGVARPSGLRLEGVAPFGPPAFILVVDESGATLLLPRDHRVLIGAAPSDVLEALVGLPLGPGDLLALVTGCVAPDSKPQSGRRFADGWATVGLDDGATLYLRQDRRGRWSVRAGVRPPLTINYDRAGSDPPTVLHVRSRDSNLQIGLAQVEINVAFPRDVFRVKVPADAVQMTLADLRQAGPMGQRR